LKLNGKKKTKKTKSEGQRKEEWLDKRKKGLGGSDAAAILGLNPWRSPVEVWLDKTGRSDPIEDNEKMYWGREHEPAIARRFYRDHGIEYHRYWNNQYAIRQHANHTYMMATPDRVFAEMNGGLEIKTADVSQAEKWGKTNTKKYPLMYTIQVAHTMAVFDVPQWWLAVLIGGNDYREYLIERDLDLEVMLVSQEAAWWSQYVVKDECPPMDGSGGATAYLEKRYPKARVPAEPATEAEAAHLRKYFELLVLIASAKDIASVMENEIREKIGDRSGIETDWGAVKWSEVSDSVGVDHKELWKAAQFCMTKEQVEKIEKEHMKVLKKGYRRLSKPSVKKLTKMLGLEGKDMTLKDIFKEGK